MPTYEIRDGVRIEVPDRIISASCVLDETIDTTLIIEPGVTVKSHGIINGTVVVRSGAALYAYAPLNGTMNVHRGAELIVHRSANGTLTIERGATVTIQPGARAFGSMNVAGTLVNFGARSDSAKGPGVIDDKPGSTVRRPDVIRADGTRIFNN